METWKKSWEWIDEHRWVSRGVALTLGVFDAHDAYRHSSDLPGLMSLDIGLAVACLFVFFLFAFQKTERLIDPVSVTLEYLSGALLIGNGVSTTQSAAQSAAHHLDGGAMAPTKK